VLEEIVVSAQRREENLQHVPISITALSAATLDHSGIQDMLQLSRLTPGLVFTHAISASQIFLRGVGPYNSSVGDENPTAVYVDGVYRSAMESSLFSFNNVGRVEVCVGPKARCSGAMPWAGSFRSSPVLRNRPRAQIYR
jgi:iron complex outermembrane receptor protein